jgi:O-antigen ligase
MTTATPAPSNRISSFILFITVAAAPFPSGSTAPAAIAFWCVALGLGVIAVSPRRLSREHLPLLGSAIIVTLAYAFVLHEQLAARPWIASPDPLWREAADTLGMPIAPSVSIARNEPFFALGAPLANMLAVICSFVVCIDRVRARQLLRVIAWSGVAYAVYGIAEYLDPTHNLWRDKVLIGRFTSTFINPNTAAVYFGSCAVLWLLFILHDLRQRLPLDSIYWKSAPHLLLSELPTLSFTMLFICLAAILMTSSRAGIVLSFMALVVAFVGFYYRDLQQRGWIAAALVIGGLTALVFLLILGENFFDRIETQGLSDPRRLETYRSTLRMIADHPWFGTGLGTFVWSFPAYRTANVSMWGVWNVAHSTPLELAADLGLPLAVLIGVAWVVVLVVLTRGVRTRRIDRIVPVGVLAVAILALAHSAIDFSLQIPGYAILVFALVGAGLAQSFSSQNVNKTPSSCVNSASAKRFEQRDVPIRNEKRTGLVSAPYNLLARSFVVILGCIAVWWGAIGFPVSLQDSATAQIANQIIAGDPFNVETLTQQLPIVDSIKRSAYCRPYALRSAAIIKLRMSEVEASINDPHPLDEHMKLLTEIVRSSLSCMPADPFLWLALYSVEITENGFKADYLKYLRTSYRLGPNEGWIALKRNPLAFAIFQQLPPDLRENAVNEFVALLESDLSEQAADIFIGPAWPERELILSRLTHIADKNRRLFSDALLSRGYDLNVPGVGLAPRDSHPFAPEIRVPE